MYNGPGKYLTQSSPYAALLLRNSQQLNNGSHAGGLASALNQGLFGYQMAQDRKAAEDDKQARISAQQALAEGLRGYTQPGARPDGMADTQVQGSLSRAQQLLAGLRNNPYASELSSSLAMQELTARQQQEQAAAERAYQEQQAAIQRANSMEDYGRKKEIDQKYATPPDQYETVQNPYGRGGVGQRNTRTGQISGYQGPQEAAGASLPFAGNGMDAQAYNTVIAYEMARRNGQPVSPEQEMAARMAFARLTQPQRFTTPDGRMFEQPGMDLSWMSQPGQMPPMMSDAPEQGGIAGNLGAPPMGAPNAPAEPKEIGRKQYPQASTDAAGYANRMNLAEKRLAELSQAGETGVVGGAEYAAGLISPTLANMVSTPQRRLYRQAQEDWVRAKLRKESGAVIGDEEMEREIRVYFPQPGDDPAVIKQKEQARQTAIQNLVAGSQGAFEDLFQGEPGPVPSELPKQPSNTPAPPPGFQVIQ